MTLNKYLNTLMDGLSAKVFRTYNASITLERQLEELMKDLDDDSNVAEKVLAYNRANRAVAILCNHQRTVPKGFDDQMEKLKEKISSKKKEVKTLKKEFKEASKGAEKDKLKKKLSTAEEQLKKLNLRYRNRFHHPPIRTALLQKNVTWMAVKIYNHIPEFFQNLPLLLFKKRLNSLLIKGAYYSTNDFLEDKNIDWTT